MPRSDYEFPRLFVKEPSEPPSPPCRVLVPDNGCYSIGVSEECSGLVEIPYEQGFQEILDLEEGRASKDFAVSLPGDRIVFVEKNTPLLLLEVKGFSPYLLVREGVTIRPRDKIAYVLTGKGEVRVLRSDVEGVIIYIGWDPDYVPEKYVIAVAGEDDVKWWRICREGGKAGPETRLDKRG